MAKTAQMLSHKLVNNIRLRSIDRILEYEYFLEDF